MPKTLKQVAIDMANAFTRWQLWQGGGSSTLSDLTDVELSDLQADDVLQYDGNKWINAIVQGGGNVGAKVDLLGTLYVGVNQPLSAITQYDLIIFLVRDNTEPWKYRGSATFTKNEIKINNQLVIPSDEIERTILTISDWSIIGRYNLVVYGVKFAPIEPNLHEYSINEKIVGKWIDGRPIYEIVINIDTFTMNSNSWQILPNFPTNIKQVININAIETNDGIYWNISAQSNGYAIQFRNTTISFNQYVIQYTKTTD